MAIGSVRATSTHFKGEDGHLTNRDTEKAQGFNTFFAFVFNKGVSVPQARGP